MEDSELLYFTVLYLVEAIAYLLTEELIQLQPSTYYFVLELTDETLTVGRLDAGARHTSSALR